MNSAEGARTFLSIESGENVWGQNLPFSDARSDWPSCWGATVATGRCSISACDNAGRCWVTQTIFAIGSLQSASRPSRGPNLAIPTWAMKQARQGRTVPWAHSTKPIQSDNYTTLHPYYDSASCSATPRVSAHGVGRTETCPACCYDCALWGAFFPHTYQRASPHMWWA